MRAAMVGLGRMASYIEDEGAIYSHARAMAEIPELELVGGCDLSARAREAFVDRWGVPAVFGDPREMFDRLRPELVVLAAPQTSRSHHIRLALDQPTTKAIVCEKPLASRADEALLIEQWVLQAGLPFVVNHSRRWCAVYETVRDWIASGRIGELRRIHAIYGGGVMNIGTHLIDTLRYLCGEFVSAQCIARSGNVDDPDIDGFLATDGGCYAVLQASSSREFLIFEIQLIGDKGAIRIVRNGEAAHLLLPAGRNKSLNLVDERLAPRDEQPLIKLYRETLTGGLAPRCGVSDGSAAVKLAQALLRSSESDNVVVHP